MFEEAAAAGGTQGLTRYAGAAYWRLLGRGGAEVGAFRLRFHEQYLIPTAYLNMMMPIYPGAPWMPKFHGSGGDVKYQEWKVQIRGILEVQELTDTQKLQFCWGH